MRPAKAKNKPAVPQRKQTELITVELPFTVRGDKPSAESEAVDDGTSGPASNARQSRAVIGKKVAALLGGQELMDKIIFKRMNHGAPLRLSFQPETPISQSSVESRVVPDAQPVVLRVKRSRKTGIIKSAEVVGVSDQHHEFNKLADFIYRPGPLDPNAQIPASLLP